MRENLHRYSLTAINQTLKRMCKRVSPLHGYQSNCPSFHNDRPRYVFITPNNYVFVLPLLHHLHRSSRLFIGPLDSTGKGFAFTAVSVQHTLCYHSQFPTLSITLCLAPLFFRPLQVAYPFGVRAFVLACLFVSLWFDSPLSWAFFP